MGRPSSSPIPVRCPALFIDLRKRIVAFAGPENAAGAKWMQTPFFGYLTCLASSAQPRSKALGLPFFP
jgi:hypothetical protein